MPTIIIQPEGGQGFDEKSVGVSANRPLSTTHLAAVQRKAQAVLMGQFSLLIGKYFIPAFERSKTGHRVKEICQSFLTMGGSRKTIANSIVVRGLDQKDWSADYRAAGVGKWESVDIYEGVFHGSVPLLGQEGPVLLGIDDTGLPKEGEEIECVGWIHNPLVPKYVKPAIQWGVPILHAALLIQGEVVHRPTAITVAFEPIPKEKARKRGVKAKKRPSGSPVEEDLGPRKRGRPTKEESAKRKAERESLIKEGTGVDGAVSDIKMKATELAVRVIWRVRKWMDAAGMAERKLLVVADSSYTNATVMLCLPHDTVYLGRTRPDSKLQALGPTTKTGVQQYGPDLPSPKQMAIEGMLETRVGSFHYAGALRDLRYLESGPLFRRTSTRKIPLRLLILEPVPYSRGKGNPKGYNLRGYLLTNDLAMPAEQLIAAYLMRWELEVIH